MSLAGANYVVLHNFTGTTGASPDVPLFQHTNGSLYGGTHFDGTNSDGVFYRLWLLNFSYSNDFLHNGSRYLGEYTIFAPISRA